MVDVIYKAADGRTFPSLAEAEAHERATVYNGLAKLTPSQINRIPRTAEDWKQTVRWTQNDDDTALWEEAEATLALADLFERFGAEIGRARRAAGGQKRNMRRSETGGDASANAPPGDELEDAGGAHERESVLWEAAGGDPQSGFFE